MHTQRIVALVDMDCFYCQVEARLDPSLKGKPAAVVQYNQWKGGGIIAVNYEARDAGVSRYMRGSEAKSKCPDIVLVSVPSIRGKADLTRYRTAGEEVAEVFCLFSECVQRASVDEAYIDITKQVDDRIKSGVNSIKVEDLSSTFIVGYSDMKSNNHEQRTAGTNQWLKMINYETETNSADFRLAVGGVIIEEMRCEILKRTGFHCSAGIAHNKILAKLAAGLHKPKCQTILPHDGVPELYETLPVNKVRGLGGKMGGVVKTLLSVNLMSELFQFTLQDLQKKFDDKTGSWLFNIARGIDMEPVTPRLAAESIGCCKNFPGKNELRTKAQVEHWLKELASEIAERLKLDLEKNKRRARGLTVSFLQDSSTSRCGTLSSYEATGIAKDALELLKKFNSASSSSQAWIPPLKYLGISVGKFMDEQTSLGKYLKPKSLSGKSSEMNSLAPTRDFNHKKENKEKTSIEHLLKPVGELMNETKSEINVPNRNNANVTSEISKYFRKSEPSCSKHQKSTEPDVTGSNEPSFFKTFLQNRKDRVIYEDEDSLDGNMVHFTLEENKHRPNQEFRDVGTLDGANENLEEVVDNIQNVSREKSEHLKDELTDPGCWIESPQPSTSGIVNKEPTYKQFENVAKPEGCCPQNEFVQVESNAIESKVDIVKEMCSECKQLIALSEFLEHIDYHAAVKLQAEMNAMSRTSALKITKTYTTGKVQSALRKRKGETSLQPADKKIRITSFFNIVEK